MSVGVSLLAVAALLCAAPPPGPCGGGGAAAALTVWTAWLNVSWEDSTDRNRSGWEASESGLYGLDSPVRGAAGLLVLPDGRDSFNACSARTNFSGAPPAGGSGGGGDGGSSEWLALIQRGGGCTFADKIRLARLRGASAVVIYNYRDTGNDVLPMSHPGAEDIVAIMIGNLKGMEILHRIESGMKVTMVIEVGKKHGAWMNQYSVFFISVSFFIVTAATMGYFIFYSARRLRIARAQSRNQQQLKAKAKKAIEQLQLRTLKQGDKETGPDGDSCVVCIELYKPNEVVRILICNHLFHKSCIDPWLLEHRTCPMCKCDILKALGVEEDVEGGTESVQATVSSRTSNISTVNEEDNHSETASSGYASVQGAEESVLEEYAPSENDNMHLVNSESQPSNVNVLPHMDNPSFEADETQVREVKS
ncbi:PREDICTED: E3 ubiquitin-protein ligase RNF128 isoform X1 [Calidris pugnax]|uniref:E3 ubiquitin-protein ligase RNF128 isoform X1 n=1 Tax=Calidris pugnax TaxID=198806 RepID=UPI00071D528A|nr:PREDICTED: E3 ubiquitin-protein ligase RNF128 isoform X1 [Calidris pugnax]